MEKRHMQKARIRYASDSTADRDRLLEIIARANDIGYWLAVRTEKQKHAPLFTGWYAGTYWIGGTPAPILTWKLRGNAPLPIPPNLSHSLTILKND